jgi:hypothetical protein
MPRRPGRSAAALSCAVSPRRTTQVPRYTYTVRLSSAHSPAKPMRSLAVLAVPCISLLLVANTNPLLLIALIQLHDE